MTREVYSDSAFIEFSRSQVFIRVFQDTGSRGERLAREFAIPGFPTIIILDSSGEEVERILGARSAGRFMMELESIFASASVKEMEIDPNSADR